MWQNKNKNYHTVGTFPNVMEKAQKKQHLFPEHSNTCPLTFLAWYSTKKVAGL
jgi:hypothetical protein